MGHGQHPNLAEARPVENPEERKGCEVRQLSDHPARNRSAGKELDRRRFMRSMIGASGAAIAAGALTTRGGPLGAPEAHAASGDSLRQRTAIVIIDPYMTSSLPMAQRGQPSAQWCGPSGSWVT